MKRICINKINILVTLSFLFLGACSDETAVKAKKKFSAPVEDTAQSIYDVAQTNFSGTTYVGDYTLNPSVEASLLGEYADSDDPAKHLYTVTMDLENLRQTDQFTPYMVPELVYPVTNSEDHTSMGLRLIPVGGDGGYSIATPNGTNNDRGVNLREDMGLGPELTQDDWWRVMGELEAIELEAYRNDPANDFEAAFAAHRAENFETYAETYRENHYEWRLDYAKRAVEEDGEEWTAQNQIEFEENFMVQTEDSFEREFRWQFEEEFFDDFWNYWDTYADNNQIIPDENNIPSNRVIDALLRKAFYGVDEKENLEKPIYAIMGHTGDYQSIFTDLEDLVSQKAETGYHHVSTYYGDNGVSRRPMLHGGHPDNVFIVSMKGTDQEAFNLNAQIWAKLYYQNPEGYNFASNYSWDYFVNSNLEEVLAFAKGWIDTDWVRKDLNQKIIDNAEQMGIDGKDSEQFRNTTYHSFLQEDPATGLYCFEGVTNMLNVAVNVPLTLEKLQRIFGEAQGSVIFNKANDRYRDILEGEGVLPEELDANDLKSTKVQTILARMDALWEKEGMVNSPDQYTSVNPLFPERNADGSVDVTVHPEILSNDAERREDYKKIGSSLAWAPQTTADIIKDLIHIYVPFHKASAANSSGVVLQFQEEHERRTGISRQTYMQFAIQIIGSMYKWESAKIKSQLAFAQQSGSKTPEEVAAAWDRYKAKQENVFTQEFGIPDIYAAAIAPQMEAAELLNVAELSADNDFGTLAWNKFLVEAKLILAEANKTPVYEPNVIRQRLGSSKGVKYYSRPGVLASMALGVWPTNPHVKITPVATVVGQSYVTPAAEDAEPDHQMNNMSADLTVWSGTPASAQQIQEFQRTLFDPVGHHE